MKLSENWIFYEVVEVPKVLEQCSSELTSSRVVIDCFK